MDCKVKGKSAEKKAKRIKALKLQFGNMSRTKGK